MNDINIDVTLDASGNGVAFRYRGADDLSRNHVKENGDIDLRAPNDLAKGPVNIRFRIGSPEIHLDGIAHRPKFAAGESMWIAEKRHGNPDGPYRQRGFLARLGLRHPQFYDFAGSESGDTSLSLRNRNNDGKEYKYTLRVAASGERGERWLEDDPGIKNGGVGLRVR